MSGRSGGRSPHTEWMRVTSSASARPSGGRIPGSLPGEHRLPRSGRACRAAGCDLLRPRPRARGEPVPARARRPGRERRLSSESARSGSNAGASISPRRYATASPRWRTATGSTPASATSGADSAAQTTRCSPARRAPSATASAPATGRTRPSSASSPTAACSASRSAGICLVAARTASEIGRSNPDPSLRNAAGARLTVIRRFSGHSSEAETTPLRTRCFASWHARSASPTIAKPGTPELQVRLDLDLSRLEPDESVGDRACEHPAEARRGGVGPMVATTPRRNVKTTEPTRAKQKTCKVKCSTPRCRSRPLPTKPFDLVPRVEERLDLLRDELEVVSVVTPGSARGDRALASPRTVARHAPVLKVPSIAPSTTLTAAVRTVIAPMTPAGPAAPAGPGRSGRSLRPGRARRQLARREVRAQQRPVRDLRRVDRVGPDLRAGHGCELQLRRARRCSSRADSPQRRSFLRARPAVRGTPPPLPATAAGSRAFACVLPFRVSCRPGYPWPRPIPSRSPEALTLLLRARGRGDQHGLEVLARAAAGPPVDVPLEASSSRSPLRSQDFGVEIATVVDDDASRARRAPGRPCIGGRPARFRRRTPRSRPGSCPRAAAPSSTLTAVVQAEQLVGVAVLLVVVDQARVRRRGEDRVEAPVERRRPARRRAGSRRRAPDAGSAGTPSGDRGCRADSGRGTCRPPATGRHVRRCL